MTCSRTKCPNRSYRYGLCEKHWLASPHGFIPAEPTREHLMALRAKGLGVYRISELTGIDHASLRAIELRTYQHVRRRTHDAIVAVPIPAKIVDGATSMPADGTARRIRALCRIGHSQSGIASHFGVQVQMINRMLRQPYVTSKWAARISDLYDELQAVDGPSASTRRQAERKGWPPPLAWDDDTIDDPKAKPQHNIRRPLRFAEQYEELLELKRAKKADEVARELGMTAENAERQIQRYREAQRKAIAS